MGLWLTEAKDHPVGAESLDVTHSGFADFTGPSSIGPDRLNPLFDLIPPRVFTRQQNPMVDCYRE